MNAEPLGAGFGHDVVDGQPAHRLAELQSVLRELRTERRSLISQLHEQLSLISSRRQMMRETWERRPQEPTVESPVLRLQDDYGMTRREAEVARLLAQGLSNSELARRLGISPHTARHHTQRVLGKLGVHSRAEAGARLRRG